MGHRSSSRSRRSQRGRRRGKKEKLALLVRVLQHPHAPRFHPQRFRYRQDGTVEAVLHTRAFEGASGQIAIPLYEPVAFLHADAVEGYFRGMGASGNRYGFGLALVRYVLEQMGAPLDGAGEFDFRHLAPVQVRILLQLYRRAQEESH